MVTFVVCASGSGATLVLVAVAAPQQGTTQNAGAECPRVCPLIYGPICAKSTSNGDFATFSNECEMRARNCQRNTDYVKDRNGQC
ncbi:hypothetical protein B566_EDAN002858 [Ephemera danica]|nr:hypothetical protein B566_EDAN002858 [Ephemera danica]